MGRLKDAGRKDYLLFSEREKLFFKVLHLATSC